MISVQKEWIEIKLLATTSHKKAVEWCHSFCVGDSELLDCTENLQILAMLGQLDTETMEDVSFIKII